MERNEMLNEFYTGDNEDRRLIKSRHGQMEYRTTMHFIHRYLKPGQSVLELGAGTGRYSIALAKEAHPVTAVDLAVRNLELLRQNAEAERYRSGTWKWTNQKGAWDLSSCPLVPTTYEEIEAGSSSWGN